MRLARYIYEGKLNQTTERRKTMERWIVKWRETPKGKIQISPMFNAEYAKKAKRNIKQLGWYFISVKHIKE